MTDVELTEQPAPEPGDCGDLTGRVVAHLRLRREGLRDPEIRVATQSHVLDSLAAVVSGRVMPAGLAVAAWLGRRSTAGRSSCAGWGEPQHAEEAAFVNAMCAHADESDDSHEPSRSHPGASIVPAALAVAEELGSELDAFLDAVALGYEACALMNWLFWTTSSDRRRASGSTHAMGGLWGSAVAAATLYGFDDGQMRSLVSYTAQLAGGVGSWLRDEHHIEKAFVFSGMPAWNGVRAAGLVDAGWPGVRDTLDDEPNFFSAFGRRAHLAALERAAGSPPIIVETNIKKYCVGSPAQAAVQAAEELHAPAAGSGGLVDRVTEIRCVLPSDLARIVDRRAMTDINVQYLVARTLLDGRCTFAAAHDEQGTEQPDVARLLERTRLVADADMEPVRQARVEVDLVDGRTLERTVFPVRGTRDDPMTPQEVDVKARDLLSMALSAEAAQDLVDACRDTDPTSLVRIGDALRASGRGRMP